MSDDENRRFVFFFTRRGELGVYDRRDARLKGMRRVYSRDSVTVVTVIVTVSLYLSHIVGVYLCTPAAPLVRAPRRRATTSLFIFRKSQTLFWLILARRVGIGETAFRTTFRERTRVSQRFEC